MFSQIRYQAELLQALIQHKAKIENDLSSFLTCSYKRSERHLKIAALCLCINYLSTIKLTKVNTKKNQQNLSEGLQTLGFNFEQGNTAILVNKTLALTSPIWSGSIMQEGYVTQVEGDDQGYRLCNNPHQNNSYSYVKG